MLTYMDFCIQLMKIIKEHKIDNTILFDIIQETIDLLEHETAPTDSYEEMIAKELQFYRNECQYLNKLRISLQLQVKQLQRQVSEEKEQNNELTNLLKNQKMDSFLQQVKEKEQNSSNQKAQTFRSTFKEIQKQPILPQTFKQVPFTPHLTIEIKNIKTPLMEYPEPVNLKDLFHQCVQQIFRENQIRGGNSKKLWQKCQRDHQGQVLIKEEEKDLSFSKLDIKTLTERFFLNPHFMKMVEAQIFQIKCCNNKACLYNFRQMQIQEETYQNEIETKMKAPRKTPIFRSDHRSKSVGRTDDMKLLYQQLFSEVLRLERELCSTPNQNKIRINELKKQLKEAGDKLVDLQTKLMNN